MEPPHGPLPEYTYNQSEYVRGEEHEELYNRLLYQHPYPDPEPALRRCDKADHLHKPEPITHERAAMDAWLEGEYSAALNTVDDKEGRDRYDRAHEKYWEWRWAEFLKKPNPEKNA